MEAAFPAACTQHRFVPMLWSLQRSYMGESLAVQVWRCVVVGSSSSSWIFTQTAGHSDEVKRGRQLQHIWTTRQWLTAAAFPELWGVMSPRRGRGLPTSAVQHTFVIVKVTASLQRISVSQCVLKVCVWHVDEREAAVTFKNLPHLHAAIGWRQHTCCPKDAANKRPHHNKRGRKYSRKHDDSSGGWNKDHIFTNSQSAQFEGILGIFSAFY